MNTDIGQLKRIFKYLLGTTECDIFYEKQSNDEIIGSDIDFASDVDTCRSTTGYIFNINNIPIT